MRDNNVQWNFDPAALALEAIEANLDSSIFDQIDDSGIHRPKNWFEWVRDPRFLNVTPFPKQVEIATNMLGQFCPRCTNPKLMARERFGNWLLDIPTSFPLTELRDQVSFLEHGRCPKCKVTKPELVASKDLNQYRNLNGVAGMRASKTVMAGGLLATYHLARYLLIQSPSKFFRLMDNQMLHMTFVALTAGQAYDTLWQAFKDRIDGSPWFKEYHSFLNGEAIRLGKENEQVYKVKDSFVWYGHKQIMISYCGPDIRTIRGRTRFFTAMDEKGWFDVQADSNSTNAKVRLNAYETHQALIKSLQTIRSASQAIQESATTESSSDMLDVPDGMNIDVSSPSSINDAIMTGLRDAIDDPSIYGFHYATWEMNPNVPLSSLRSEMRNKSTFERDYAAIPPLGSNQFVGNQPAIEKCQTDKSQNFMVTWDRKHFVDNFGDKTLYLEVKPSVKDKNRPRILTVDTGLTSNSFAVSLWSYDRESKMPVCDVALEAMPEQIDTERIPVNFPLMFEHCVLPLIASFRVVMVVYDRWNSIDQVQRLRKDHKIEAVQYQLKWTDMLSVRTRLLDSTIRYPKMELSIEDVRKSAGRFEDTIRSVPITHMVLQTLTVREAGRKVVKPINGTDDLFRCMCLADVSVRDG